jgi:hypothetical protein
MTHILRRLQVDLIQKTKISAIYGAAQRIQAVKHDSALAFLSLMLCTAVNIIEVDAGVIRQTTP